MSVSARATLRGETSRSRPSAIPSAIWAAIASMERSTTARYASSISGSTAAASTRPRISGPCRSNAWHGALEAGAEDLRVSRAARGDAQVDDLIDQIVEQADDDVREAVEVAVEDRSREPRLAHHHVDAEVAEPAPGRAGGPSPRRSDDAPRRGALGRVVTLELTHRRKSSILVGERQGRPARAKGTEAVRADARRNREQVLEAAREAFAAHGPAVPLEEIAGRAAVGVGTVYRHFATKENLS